MPTISDFVIYVCPYCGRTLKHENPSIYTPDTRCFHVVDGKEVIYMMTFVYPTQEGAIGANDMEM